MCTSDSFTIFGLWVLGLAVSHINESNCKLMSPEHYFNDKSAILLHPGTLFIPEKKKYTKDAGWAGNKITGVLLGN